MLKKPSPTPPPRADAILDTYGLLCPLPIMRTAERVKMLRSGSVLEVVSSDPGIQIDLPNWCRTQGHEFLGCHKTGRIIKGYLRVRKR